MRRKMSGIVSVETQGARPDRLELGFRDAVALANSVNLVAHARQIRPRDRRTITPRYRVKIGRHRFMSGEICAIFMIPFQADFVGGKRAVSQHS